MVDVFRSRSTRLIVAWLIGTNIYGLVIALSLVIAYAVNQMVIAFIGSIAGLAVAVAAGLAISNAMKRL